jgi:hypothetical protein
MTDVVTTVAQAPSSPTAPGPLTQRQAEPTRHDGSPRPGLIADSDYDRLDPAEQAKYARVRKGPQGGSEWIERAKLEAERTDPAKTGTAPAPGEKVKIGDFELSGEDVATILQERAARDLRATQIPATVEDYQGVLPDTLKLPAGMEFKVDTSEPAFNDLRAVAKKIGLTQSEFSDILAIHASREMANEAMVRTAAQAELTKLGPNGTMRVTAIDTFVRGLLGDDLGGAMKSAIFTEKHVRGWEAIMKKMGTQGHASFRQDGREVNNNGKGPLSSMSKEQYNATPASERFRLSRLGH